MGKTTHMFMGIVGCTLVGIFLIFGDFSLSSSLTQQFHRDIAHAVIWLCFLVGAIGCALAGIGAYVITKAAKPAKLLP